MATKTQQFYQKSVHALHRLSRAIVGAPDLDTVCEAVLKEAVKIIPVETASIMRYEADCETLHVVAAIGIPKDIQKEARVKVGEGISGKVFSSSKPLLVSDIRMLSGVKRRTRYKGKSLIAAPMTCLPLRMAGKPVGVINMTDKISGEPFSEEDLALLKTLANQAAAYMHLCFMADELAKAQHVERELEIAREVQQGLMPQDALKVPGMDVAGDCLPSARVGGDYYDVCVSAHGRPTAIIADVAGHNVSAALTMAAFRSLMRTRMQSDSHATHEHMSFVHERLQDDLQRAEQFITAALLSYDQEEGRVDYCLAGHHAPYHYSKSRDRVTVLTGESGVIGVEDHYTSEHVEVSTGDVIFLFTDGLIQITNAKGEAFGPYRLRNALRKSASGKAKGIVAAVRKAVETFAGSEPFDDDVTMVALKFS